MILIYPEKGGFIPAHLLTLCAYEAHGKHGDSLGGGNLRKQPNIIGVVIVSKVDHTWRGEQGNSGV